MRYFVTMYSAFHTDPEFHKKIADVSYKVLEEISHPALDDFMGCESGLAEREDLELAMGIVYNLLQKEIKDFYDSDISKEEFINRVILEDEFGWNEEDIEND